VSISLATPALLGLAAALTWGLHDFIGRFSARAIGQTNTTFGVMLAGLVALTVILLAGTGLPAIAPDRSLVLALVAGIAYAAATLFLFTGYRIGSMSVVSPLAGSYPALNVAFNVAMGSRPDGWAWAGMGAVLAGSLVVALATAEHEKTGHIGEGLSARVVAVSLAAALCFALGVGAGQAAAAASGALEATWLARIGAVATVAGVLFIPRLRAPAPFRWWPAVAVMGLLDTTAMVCVFKAGEMPSPEIAAVTGASFGGIVSLLGWIVLKEPVGALQWFGIGLIMAGAGVLTAWG
jgi:drug/metabolite transporter (DMT)-like permease